MTIEMWTIYDHPLDFPDQFVARRWSVVRGSLTPIPSDKYLKSASLDDLHRHFRACGYEWLPRMEDDDPVILGIYML